MEIEVGKAYRTRGGWKAVVEDDNYDTGVVLPYPLLVDHDGHGRIKHAANGKYWSDNDRHSHNNSNAEFDLVSEWTDEPAAVAVNYTSTSESTLAVNAALDAKIKRYEDALRFYADGYYDEGGGVRDIFGTDTGERARKALEYTE